MPWRRRKPSGSYATGTSIPEPMTSDVGEAGVDRRGEVALRLREEPDAARSGEDRLEDVETGLGLVVEARHEDGAFRCDLTAGERGPEEVRREDERAVRVRLVEQVVEQLGEPEIVVHPAFLVAHPQRRPGDDRGVERGAFGARRGDHRGEPADGHAVGAVAHTGRELVLPREVVAGARGEDVDLPAAAREPERHLLEHGLGATDDTVAVSRRNESEPALALHERQTLRPHNRGTGPGPAETPALPSPAWTSASAAPRCRSCAVAPKR